MRKSSALDASCTNGFESMLRICLGVSRVLLQAVQIRGCFGIQKDSMIAVLLSCGSMRGTSYEAESRSKDFIESD